MAKANRITGTEIWPHVEAEAQESGISIPDGLEEAFEERFGMVDVAGLKGLGRTVCSGIRTLLEEDETLRRDFGHFYQSIAGRVRVRLAKLLLGAEAEIASPKPQFGGKSSREMLLQFLEEFALPTGKSWDQADVRNWRDETGEGKKLYCTINEALGWTSEAVHFVLGTNAHLLEQKGFRPRQAFNNPMALSEVLHEFYMDVRRRRAQGEDAQVNSASLRDWQSTKYQTTGWNVYHAIRRLEGGWCEDNIRTILGSSANDLLSELPFKKDERKLTTLEIAKDHLHTFVASLPPGETWNKDTLIQWSGEVLGGTLKRYIEVNGIEGEWDQDKLLDLVDADTAALLRDRPFEGRIIDEKKVRARLKEFLESLPDGMDWGPQKMILWEGHHGVTGLSIYHWILRNYIEFSIENIQKILGPEARLLKNHPLKKRFKVYSTSASETGKIASSLKPLCLSTKELEIAIHATKEIEKILDELEGDLFQGRTKVQAIYRRLVNLFRGLQERTRDFIAVEIFNLSNDPLQVAIIVDPSSRSIKEFTGSNLQKVAYLQEMALAGLHYAISYDVAKHDLKITQVVESASSQSQTPAVPEVISVP